LSTLVNSLLSAVETSSTSGPIDGGAGNYSETALTGSNLQLIALTSGTTTIPAGDLQDQVTVYTGGGFTPQNGSSPVPEPASITLLGLGVVCLAAYRWRRRQETAIA
jgi:hypothetical protein